MMTTMGKTLIADPPQPKKKKASNRGPALAKDASQLKNKKPDLEFTVDPLFKKTVTQWARSKTKT
jgi:hypothetical protein